MNIKRIRSFRKLFYQQLTLLVSAPLEILKATHHLSKNTFIFFLILQNQKNDNDNEVVLNTSLNKKYLTLKRSSIYSCSKT